MTTAIVLACVAAYLTTAVLFARSRIVKWSNDPQSLMYEADGGDRVAGTMAALGLGLIWPAALLFLRFRDWMWRPVDKAEARRERLNDDLANWMLRFRNSTDEAEKRMAYDIVETLRDLLREQR